MRYVAVFKLTLLLFLFLNGCGQSSLQNAKSTVIAVGMAWMEVDDQFADAYEKARVNARETSSTWEERDEKIASWEEARKMVAATGFAIKSAALAISIAEERELGGWQNMTEKALEAVASAFDALEKLDLKIPAKARKALETGRMLLEGG
jgi:hypothetical protein